MVPHRHERIEPPETNKGIEGMEEERRWHQQSSRSNRPMSDATADVFFKLGIDPTDVEDLRELAADLYYLRRQRVSHQARVAMNWTTVISAIASAVVGAFSVVLAELLQHKG